MKIRRTTPSDLGAVDALLARSYPVLLKSDYPPSVLVMALPLIARARPELVASGTYFLAETDDARVVAAGGWTFAAPTDGQKQSGLAHIRHVVTDPTMTRRGIARCLLTRVMADAAASGVTEFDCLSTRTAVPFYASMGFEPLNLVDVPLRPGIHFPAVRMRRSV